MFESAELGHSIDDPTYKRKANALRADLLDAQYDLIENPAFSVVILINGVDGAGKGETVNLLNEWMDTRHIENRAFGDPSEEERERPYMWRFWRVLPPKGKVGIFFGNWYTSPIVRRVFQQSNRSELQADIDRIIRFERMLSDENVLLLKFWFHLSKKAQKKRLNGLEEDRRTRWRVTKEDWRAFELYDKFRKVSEWTLRQTSMGNAPWTVVEGQDPNYRHLTTAIALLEALRKLKREPASSPRAARGRTPRSPRAASPEPRLREPPLPVPPLLPAIDGRLLLRSLDLTKRVGKERYERDLEAAQRKLNLLSRHSGFKKISVVVVFEGADAAGKGGAIRRITLALDARQYQVVQIAAPTEEERARPYLWRFWRHVPRRGRVTMFDRSWYGRVLVERVEGLALSASWLRAYSEINEFEEQLAEHGVVLVKIWLAVSKAEQLRRFREREKTRFKRFKITEEDWRNRKKWNAYDLAATDMIDRTSTEVAPWTLVEADDKHYARLKTLRTLCDRIERAL